MKHKTLIEQIEDAATQVGCDVHKVVRDAYVWAFGEHCNIRNEADHAGKRFRKRRTLSEKAIEAVQHYLHHRFGWPPRPMPQNS